MSRSILLARAALAAALCSVFSAAAESSADATDLDEVVVTATRTAQTLADTLASTTVIDRERIDRLQPNSLADLLRGVPGLTFANSGGLGKQTSVFLRGSSGSQVLVMIDGVRIGSASAGLVAFQDIPVEQIERVEIVRGPFSSLYGSEALGGVIQIFTRRPEAAFSPHASVALGSFDSRRASAGVAGKRGNGWYSIDAAHASTEGINACRGSGTLFVGCFTDEPDRDGYRNNSMTVQGGYRFNDAWDAEARLFRIEGRNEYDGSFANESDVVQQIAGARLRYAPSRNVAITLNAGRSVDESDDYKDGVFGSRFDTHRDLGSLQADLGVGLGLVSLGVDWQQDAVDSNTAFDRTRRTNRALFGQWQGDAGRNSWQASLRRDDDSQFGGETTGSARYGFAISDDLKVVASYGTAYRAPTFNDLYYPGFSNPDLRPETSRSVELGLRGAHAHGRWSLSAYDTRAKDLITFDSTTFLPANVARARIRGAEASADTEIAGWTVAGTATWVDARDDGRGGTRDHWLPRRARQSGRIDLDRRFGDFSIGGSVYAEGKRYDDLANNSRLGGYALVDLRVAYAIDADWTVQVNAGNVFDRDYETVAYYNQLGRNYQVTVTYRPQR